MSILSPVSVKVTHYSQAALVALRARVLTRNVTNMSQSHYLQYVAIYFWFGTGHQ